MNGVYHESHPANITDGQNHFRGLRERAEMDNRRTLFELSRWSASLDVKVSNVGHFLYDELQCCGFQQRKPSERRKWKENGLRNEEEINTSNVDVSQIIRRDRSTHE